MPGKQGGNRKGKGHRKTDIAHVEQGRVKNQAGILQKRVEIVAIFRNIHQAFEGRRRQKNEQQHAKGDEPEHTDDACHHGFRQCLRQQRHRQCPCRQKNDPEQERAFMPAPNRRHAVNHGQFRIGMLGNISH